MKIFRRLLLAGVLLLIAIGAGVYFYLDRIVKTTIETQATSSLSLQTTLNSASLALLGGKVNLSQLQIGSPKGFTAPHMFEMGNLGVLVD